MPKAFMITFLVSTGKKGISSTELSRKLSLRQKTCYYFKRKVMTAMQSSVFIIYEGTVEVDDFLLGGAKKYKLGEAKARKDRW